MVAAIGGVEAKKTGTQRRCEPRCASCASAVSAPNQRIISELVDLSQPQSIMPNIRGKVNHSFAPHSSGVLSDDGDCRGERFARASEIPNM